MRILAAITFLWGALALCGCGKAACGPDTCAGCCDDADQCQLPTEAHCGLHGATCNVCVGVQRCQTVLGQCENPGGGGAAGGTSGATSSTGSSTGSSSGSIGGTTAGSSGTVGGSSSTGGISASGSSSSTGGSTGTTSTSSTSTSTSTTTTSSSTTTTTAGGTTSTSSTSGTSTSTSTTTTGGGTTSTSTTGGTTTTTGTAGTTGTSSGQGTASVSGADAFVVQTALEFTATGDGGSPDTSDVSFVFYDAPITCADVMAAGGRVPSNVDTIIFGEVQNIFGFSLQGGDYTVPLNDPTGFPQDNDSLIVRHFFTDGGYLDHTASSGNIHLNSPVDATALTGNFQVGLDDGSSLVSSGFYAPFCMTQ